MLDPEAVRAFEYAGWQRVATAYDDTFAHASRPFVEPLLDAVGLSPGSTLLDVCCGTGVAAGAAARRGAAATGLDFSVEMLAAARRSSPALRFDEGDAEVLPYPDCSFDAAISNFGIHHVPRPALAISEIRRVLRKGGRFAFTCWANPAENVAWRLVFDAIAVHGTAKASAAPPSGGNLDSPDAVRRLLDDNGFGNVETGFLRRQWVVRNPAEIVDVLARGTVRTAASITAQAAEARAAIDAAVTEAAVEYRRGDYFAVPIVAILASGVR